MVYRRPPDPELLLPLLPVLLREEEDEEEEPDEFRLEPLDSERRTFEFLLSLLLLLLREDELLFRLLLAGGVACSRWRELLLLLFEAFPGERPGCEGRTSRLSFCDPEEAGDEEPLRLPVEEEPPELLAGGVGRSEGRVDGVLFPGGVAGCCPEVPGR